MGVLSSLSVISPDSRMRRMLPFSTELLPSEAAMPASPMRQNTPATIDHNKRPTMVAPTIFMKSFILFPSF